MSKECRNPECVRYINFSSDDNFCGNCGSLLISISSPVADISDTSYINPTTYFTPNELRILKQKCEAQLGRPRKAVGERRVCLGCNNKRKCTPTETAHLCEYCTGKNVYCDGPIETPHLWDVAPSWRNEMEMLSSYYHQLTVANNLQSDFELKLSINQSLLSGPRIPERDLYPLFCRIDLEHLNGSNLVGDNAFEHILEVINDAAEVTLENWPDETLDDFKCICNRFVAGMLLLAKPKLCLLGPDASNLSASPFIVLETLRQLSQRVHNLYFALFEQLRTILQCRTKIGYGQKMASAAFYVGKVHGAVAFLDKAVSNGVHSVLKMPPFAQATATILEEISFIGRGLDNAKGLTSNCFDLGSSAIANMRLPMVYVDLASSDDYLSEDLANGVSFPEVFQHFIDEEE